MKVALYVKTEWSDEQREALAARLDGPGGKKRKASSEEMKDFLWLHGSGWAYALGVGDVADADDDLIGGDEAEADPLEDLI